jgi:hypothetical protein
MPWPILPRLILRAGQKGYSLLEKNVNCQTGFKLRRTPWAQTGTQQGKKLPLSYPNLRANPSEFRKEIPESRWAQHFDSRHKKTAGANAAAFTPAVP